MSELFTDREMILAAQLSYLEFDQTVLDELAFKLKGYPTVRELIIYTALTESERADINDSNDLKDKIILTDLRERIYKVHYNYNPEVESEGRSEVERFIDRLIGVDLSEATNNTDESNYKWVTFYDPNDVEKLEPYYEHVRDENIDASNVWDLTDKDRAVYNDYSPWNGKRYYLECAEWKVYNVLGDQNSIWGSGIYALTLMPTDDEAIVSFRGSENSADKNPNHDSSAQNVQNALDWVIGDFTLQLNVITDQERDAAAYLKTILEKDEFSQVSTTGHSLGGELALTAAAISVDNLEKFKQGNSFDGPGHPEEYYKLPEVCDNYNNYEFRSKLKHYFYTAVGSFYNSLALEENYLRAHTLANEAGYAFCPHSLYNIDVNLETGSVVTVADDYLEIVDGNHSNDAHFLANAVKHASQYVEKTSFINGTLTDINGLLQGLAKAYILNKQMLEYNGLPEDEKKKIDEYYFGDKIEENSISFLKSYSSLLSGELKIFSPGISLTPMFDLFIDFYELENELSSSANGLVNGKYKTSLKSLLNGVYTASASILNPEILLPSAACAGMPISNEANKLISNAIMLVLKNLTLDKVDKFADFVCTIFNIKDSNKKNENELISSISSKILSGLVDFSNQSMFMFTKIIDAAYSEKNSNLEEAASYMEDFFLGIKENLNNQLQSLKKSNNELNRKNDFAYRYIANVFYNSVATLFDMIPEYIDSNGSKIRIKRQEDTNEVKRIINDLNSHIWSNYSFSDSNVFGFDNGSNTNDFETLLRNKLENLRNILDTATHVVRYVPDPLVLDLENDGIDILSIENGVYFDEDNKGLRERTQWISANDALLAIDLNNDGIINGGAELFGTSSVLVNGSLARSGFEALEEYDSNEDGILDDNDELFDNILIWQDKNTNGISDEGELISLKDMGVESITLNNYGSDEERKKVISLKNGNTIGIQEVDFLAHYYDSKEFEDYEINEEINDLPNIISIGNVPSLHVLMQLDESGSLKELVNEFSSTTNIDVRRNIVSEIIYSITGANDIETGSRGNEFDAKKLRIIEAFMGEDFVGTGGSNPVNTAAPILEEIYNEIFNIYYVMLAKDSVLKPYLSLMITNNNEDGTKYIDTSLIDFVLDSFISDGNNMSGDVAEIARFISVYSNNIENLRSFVEKYVKYEDCMIEMSKSNLGFSFGSDADDSLSGSNNDDTLFSGNGDDILNGNNGNDFLYGNEGDDTIYGGNGNDTLIGGEGTDRLEGGYHNDTYVFNLGDGEDTIYDFHDSYSDSRADKILFGEGITPESVKLEREGNNLVITYGENDKVTVEDAYRYYYGEGKFMIETVEFADGTKYELSEIANLANQLDGTEEDDTISGFGSAVGYNYSETIHGLAGNDTISGNDGADTIYGDEGDDTIYGGNGNDTLIGGEGTDRLE